MSELTAELNRMAGTTGLDSQGAANRLAGTVNRDLVGALNVYAGTSGIELNGVVKLIAAAHGGTATLDANHALVGATSSPQITASGTSVSAGSVAISIIASFTPTDIAGLEVWFKADAITGLSDNDPIALWPDSSGNLRSAVQATSGNKPVYKTGVFNGLPVARFDGVDDWIGTAPIALSNGNFTFFIVCKTNGSGYQGLLTKDDNFTPGSFEWRLESGTSVPTLFRDGTGIGATNPPGTTNPRVIEATSTGTTIAHFLDGVSNGSGTGGTPNADSPTQGIRIGNRDTASIPFSGDIAETLIYSSSLSSGDRLSVRSYLGSKYGITVV